MTDAAAAVTCATAPEIVGAETRVDVHINDGDSVHDDAEEERRGEEALLLLAQQRSPVDAAVAAEAAAPAAASAGSDEGAKERAPLRRLLWGGACLVAVAAIWVGAAELVQSKSLLFEGGRLPFVITWINVGEFMVLLPLQALLSSRFCRARATTTTTGRGGGGGVDIVADPDGLDDDTSRLVGHNDGATTLVAPTAQEPKRGPPPSHAPHWRVAARAALLVSPLWFLAQCSYNASLSWTTVTSSTLLSTCSCVFTFAIAIALRLEAFSWPKLLGVAVTLAGAACVSLADAPRGGGGGAGPAAAPRAAWAWAGDALALFSALMYACYTTAIRRLLPEGGGVSMTAFFGLLGAFTFVALTPVVLALGALRVEDARELLSSPRALALVLAKGLLDNVLSDLLWARAIVLTSPTLATTGLALTIPLAMLADAWAGAAPSPLLAAGGALVAVGFLASATAAASSAAASPSAASPALEASAGAPAEAGASAATTVVGDAGVVDDD